MSFACGRECGVLSSPCRHQTRREASLYAQWSCCKWQCALTARPTASRHSARCVTHAAVVADRTVPLKRIPTLPFVKIAGQDDMKLAILLNVIDPKIGGVLIMGDRGTGKSVAVSLCAHHCLTKRRARSPHLTPTCLTGTGYGRFVTRD